MQYLRTKSLLFTLNLLPLFLSAQVWQQNNLEYGHQFKGIKTGRALLIPLIQTTAGQGRDTGAIYYKLADSSIYVYTGSQWRQVTGGGGGGSADSSIFATRYYTGQTYVPYTGATTNVNIGEFNLSAGQVTFDQTPTGTAGVGVVRWNDTDGTLDIGMKGGNVVQQVGQELPTMVKNGSGSLILDGSVVYLSGSDGTNATIELARADAEATSKTVIGVATEDIANGQKGLVTTYGRVRNINTSALTEGQPVYLSSTVAGGFTSTAPTGDTYPIVIGFCERSHASQGVIFVHADREFVRLYELDTTRAGLDSRIASKLAALKNAGTGYDLAKQGTDSVKRVQGGFGIDLDSNSTASTVIFKVDSTKVPTTYALDTAKVNIRAEITQEGVTWGTLVQRKALDTSTLREGYEFYQTDQLRGKYEFSSEMGWRFIGAPEMYVVNDQFNFEAGAVGSQHTASVSGTNAVARVLPFASTKYDSLHNRGNGIWEIATGTTSTGFSLIFTNGGNFGILRNSRFYSEARIWIDTLSDATNSYLFRLGIKARGSLPNDMNAVYFVYSDTTFSGAGTWATVTTDGSGATTMKNTSIVPNARGWVRLGIEWYSDQPTATYRAKFYINDVLVGTHERISGVGDNITELVEGGSHVTSSSIRKLAGATNRQIFFDYYNAINQNKQ